MARFVNKRELSELLNVSERTLTSWQKEGMPVADKGGRGAAHRYDVADVVRWLTARGGTERESLDLNAERARLARAQAERTELALARERGLLIERTAVILTWTNFVAVWRARLWGLPTRLAAFVGTTVDERTRIKDTAQQHIRELLTEMATAPATPDEDRDDGDKDPEPLDKLP